MKLSTTTLVILTSFILSFVASPVRAQDGGGVSFQVFYDGLGDQGSWIETDNYGYCWQPNIRETNWRPYSRGYWVETDYGWAWVSNERFGWATYHYGRWANIEGIGWIWVPGHRWAPAWVSWRSGGGYYGWAPLPPESDEYYGGGGLNVAVGFRIGDNADIAFSIGAGSYNFIPSNRMGERDYGAYYVNRRDNYRTINGTRNITSISVNESSINSYSGVNSGGPSLQEVNAVAKTHVRHVNLVASNQSGSAVQQGNSLAVYAPKVDPNTRRSAKPARITQTLAQPTINRGNDVTKPQAVTSSVKKTAAPSTEAIKTPRTAQGEASSNAKTVKAHAPARTDSTKPVTETQPAASTTEAVPHRTIEKPDTTSAPVAHKKKDNSVNAPSRSEVPAKSSTAQTASPSQSESSGQEGFTKQKQKANRQDSQAPSRSERVTETPERSQVVPVPKKERQVKEVPPAPSRPSSQAQGERPSKVKEPAKQEAPAKSDGNSESDTGGGGGGSEKEKHRH